MSTKAHPKCSPTFSCLYSIVIFDAQLINRRTRKKKKRKIDEIK